MASKNGSRSKSGHGHAAVAVLKYTGIKKNAVVGSKCKHGTCRNDKSASRFVRESEAKSDVSYVVIFGQGEKMSETGLRLTESREPPTLQQVESWIGSRAYGFWTRVSNMISRNYPGVFTPEWLFGGKKHGWSLRYKKSRSFCTLIPQKNCFLLLIVFGADERSKVETLRHALSVRTRKSYDEATTYHDGKWLLLSVDDEAIVSDVERLLAVKRRPKR